MPGNNSVYLTFDDGPAKDTGDLLDLLYEQEVKATFFLLGEQVEKFSGQISRMRSEGHTVANHGYEHLSGWLSNTESYLENVSRGAAITQSNLFRPPYGRMSPQQWRLFPEDQRIVMWSHMPGDFDDSISDEECVHRATDQLSDGSIIVLHDNKACHSRIQRILPSIIQTIKEKGFRLEALPHIS